MVSAGYASLPLGLISKRNNLNINEMTRKDVFCLVKNQPESSQEKYHEI